ncbi:hypothetical protein LMH87_011337 [Akanthomyces muscarius]|uniref:NAD(P)-binding domain-containing protein n=1 Tax=Akanthomyces muscarius TaxID=2231603 RepID=A0A9W8Q9I2_AKAMU|nr:hypothetical protein LMH87_011337 [Akanthomyces muscarius]KAJ4150595.1 hypothetical protein LMH87_011337 [Akanthomyces muscarius]
MQLIIAGATGLVGKEITRQSLQHENITSVVALSRGKFELDATTGGEKLQCVTVKDYDEYPNAALQAFAGADACIWTVAITPFRAPSFSFDEVERVCRDCTLAGLQAMMRAAPNAGFRFLYLSAEGTPREADANPRFMKEYQLMRGATERMVLGFKAEYPGTEVAIAQPGVVTNSTTLSRSAMASMFAVMGIFTSAIPNIRREDLASAALHQVLNGFVAETLSNAELVRLGRLQSSD